MGEKAGSAKVKKKAIIWITVILIASLVIFTVNALRVREEKNSKIAMHVQSALLGKTFSGNRREYGTRSGGAMTLTEFTDIEITCEFRQDGTAGITTTESFCNGIAVVSNGNIIYDSSYTKEKEYRVGEVAVSNAGNVKIKIGSDRYSIVVENEKNPVAIIIDGAVCELVE